MNAHLKNSLWGLFLIPFLSILAVTTSDARISAEYLTVFCVVTVVLHGLGLGVIAWLLTLAMGSIVFSELVGLKINTLSGVDNLFAYLTTAPIGLFTTVTIVTVTTVCFIGFNLCVRNVVAHIKGQRLINAGRICLQVAVGSLILVTGVILHARSGKTLGRHMPGFESIEAIRSIGSRVTEAKTKDGRRTKTVSEVTEEMGLGKPSHDGQYRDRTFAYWVPLNPYKIEDIPRSVIEQMKRFENAPLAVGNVGSVAQRTDSYGRVREVGYGITPAEIRSAKAIGLLPERAGLPRSMTKAQADRWFMEITLPTYAHLVNRQVNIRLSVEQWWSLISFCHNLGPGNLQRLLSNHSRMELSNKPAIGRAMLRYNLAGGQVLDGLTRRRQAESRCFLRNSFSAYAIDQRPRNTGESVVRR